MYILQQNILSLTQGEVSVSEVIDNHLSHECKIHNKHNNKKAEDNNKYKYSIIFPTSAFSRCIDLSVCKLIHRNIFCM